MVTACFSPFKDINSWIAKINTMYKQCTFSLYIVGFERNFQFYLFIENTDTQLGKWLCIAISLNNGNEALQIMQ